MKKFILFVVLLFLFASCNTGPYSISDGTNYNKEQQQMNYDKYTDQLIEDKYYDDLYHEYKRQEKIDRMEAMHPDGPDEDY